MSDSPAAHAAHRERLLRRLGDLRTATTLGAPFRHKPLVLLHLLATLHRTGCSEFVYEDVKRVVVPLLDVFGHPKRGRQQVFDPVGRLARSDKLITLVAPNWSGGDPSEGALRGSAGALAPEYLTAALRDPLFVRDAVRVLMTGYFRSGQFEELLGLLGLPSEWALVTDDAAEPDGLSPRDPIFREHVLGAYSYRCAATGFQAMLRDRAFGLEAAHIRPYADGGTCDVRNGIALNPLMHRLFDMGAWSLADDLSILVSPRFSESGWDVLHPLRGRCLAATKNPEDRPSVESLRFHRAEWGF